MGITRRQFALGLGTLTIVSAAAVAVPPIRRLFHPLFVRLQGRRTVDERVAEFSAARARMADRFRSAGITYPPGQVILLGLKDERRLEVYAGPAADRRLRRVADFPIAAASGRLGPKLAEGDNHVPEGVYAVESLNPNSRFHAALRVGYPNELDRRLAARDGRPSLGGDIMIHGGSASIGCLAMGDPTAEELFVLAADVGVGNMTVVLAPIDLRGRPLPAELDVPSNVERYAAVRAELTKLAEAKVPTP